MPRLTDPEILERYTSALTEWQIAGAIELVGRAHQELRETLEGVTEKGFKEALAHFVLVEKGAIDQVKEEREGWRGTWEYHYDLRPTIHGVRLYVETRLYPESFSSSQDPMIQVVRVKPV